MTALSREALCFPRRHEWCLEEVRSPLVSWQKSCSLASACCRLLLSGSEYPVRSPAGALLRSPIRIILSLGCFSTHAAMISQTSCCSTGLAAVNWYRLMMTNLPPLLVVVERANALPLTTGWRPFPRRSCRTMTTLHAAEQGAIGIILVDNLKSQLATECTCQKSQKSAGYCVY